MKRFYNIKINLQKKEEEEKNEVEELNETKMKVFDLLFF